MYALTDLMDRSPYAIIWEAVRCSLGLTFLFQQNDWFGASNYLSSIQYIVEAYFIVSLVVTGWLVIKHRREDVAAIA